MVSRQTQPRRKGSRLIARRRLILAGIAAYANCLRVPFLLDDAWNVLHNPSIRHLRRLGTVLAPPVDLGVGDDRSAIICPQLRRAGRSASYHLVNVAIHILAALILWNRAADDQARPGSGERGIWLLHPLQTASVTYISQRSEELMGLFYLLTLYCFIRYSDETLAAVHAQSPETP